MLVLKRNPGEGVVISDQIQIKVLEIRGDAVRLGFDAPVDVEIHRDEVWAAIQREKTREGAPDSVC